MNRDAQAAAQRDAQAAFLTESGASSWHDFFQSQWDDPVFKEQMANDERNRRESDRKGLERLDLPPEPFDFAWLCRNIGRRVARLSPLLSTFYFRQAISSQLDFLLSSEGHNLSYQDIELWYASVLKILRVQHDYEPQLAEFLDLHEHLAEINAVFGEAVDQMDAAWQAQHRWYPVLTSEAFIQRLNAVCKRLASSARSIIEYRGQLETDEFQAEVDEIEAAATAALLGGRKVESSIEETDMSDVGEQSDEGQGGREFTAEQRHMLWRIATSRQVAEATLDLLAGRPDDALRRCIGDRFSDAVSGLEADEDRAELLRLRLLTLRAEARAALGLEPPVDEGTAQQMTAWSNAFFANWLDQPHASTWWEDGEDDHLSLQDWLEQPTQAAFESGDVAESLKRDYATRIAVLSRGELMTSLAGLGYVHSARSSTSAGPNAASMMREGLRLLEEMRPVVEELRPTAARLDHLVDITLDIKYDQQTILGIMSAAGEDRIARSETFLRACVPGWQALNEESRRELLAAELEYRALLAGDREPEHAAAVAALFYRPLEREYAVWERDREKRRLPPEDPPNWNVFKDERGYAVHADQFGEIDLTRMRSYLFGLYRRKDGLLASIARAAAARAPR